MISTATLKALGCLLKDPAEVDVHLLPVRRWT